ncbi:Transmembrane protein [Pseudolycoriella hygida]|uniref:Transmembrane protein n=1 Tax=Pseudolycoriella hygida TaxID=35572 RepID=A0A9Q0N4D0_9DIPT|nr:Transmembrane protein [Pseudolycoriella hygida]
MALLGAQLVITLVMVSVIQKLSPHYSLAKWFLCSTGLIRYLHPSDSELKILAGVPKNIQKPKKDSRNKNYQQDDKSNTFHVPRNLDIQLETAKISPFDVVHLRYYTEYQWLVDFSLYAGIVYILSEIYHFYFPIKEEINLSMMWCFLVIFFSFKLLTSLTIQYFRSEESIGERSTCIVTGLTYLLISMVILIIDENTLETGLEQAGPASKIIVKFCMAVSCGIVGAIFTFPGLRMARMHWDSLKYCKENKIMQLLLNISFALPFILVLLWVKPLSRDYLTERIFSGMNQPLLTPNSFDTIRLILVVFTVILRFSLMPVYLQAYLNLAYDRIQEMKREAGRITNVELQKKIASIFYYLCVVTLQYVAPIIMCMYFALMYKTLGGYKWTDLYRASVVPQDECSINDIHPPLTDSTEDMDILTTAKMSLRGLKAVFTTEVYRGLFGFATWWSCFVWFAASALGMVYQSYFSKM